MSKILHLIPFLSKKSNSLLEIYNRYTFLVDINLNKNEIADAVNKLFNVKVLKVFTMIYYPNFKKKNTKYGLKIGKTNKFKKAIIQLKEDQKIDIYKKIK